MTTKNKKGFFGNITAEIKAVTENPATRAYLAKHDPDVLAALDRRVAKMEKADAAAREWSAPAAFQLP